MFWPASVAGVSPAPIETLLDLRLFPSIEVNALSSLLEARRSYLASCEDVFGVVDAASGT